MKDDIVTTLRRESFYVPTSRLNSFGMPQLGFALTSFNLIAADEIERLRKERDEARQEICLLRASSTNATEKVSFEMIAYAASRGWEDLFADEGKHERDA